jgi:uncharacterized membrane protein YqjE
VANHPPAPEAEGGVIRQVRQLIQASIQYSSARMRLARLESKEAAVHSIKLLLVIAGTIGVAMFAWFFLCFGVVAWLAVRFGDWTWAALAVAGAHVVLLFILSAVLKKMSATPLFPLTTEELKKDREWLETHTQTKQP